MNPRLPRNLSVDQTVPRTDVPERRPVLGSILAAALTAASAMVSPTAQAQTAWPDKVAAVPPATDCSRWNRCRAERE